MAFENVKACIALLKRSPETEKDYSLKDMKAVLDNTPYVKSICLTENDRGVVRDIKCSIDFYNVVLSFELIASVQFFSMRNVRIDKDGVTTHLIWSSNYDRFVLDMDTPDKRIVYGFLAAVTEVL